MQGLKLKSASNEGREREMDPRSVNPGEKGRENAFLERASNAVKQGAMS